MFTRIPAPVGTDTQANPVEIGGLGSKTVVIQLQAVANFVQQAWLVLWLVAADRAVAALRYRGPFGAIRHIRVSMPCIAADCLIRSDQDVDLSCCFL